MTMNSAWWILCLFVRWQAARAFSSTQPALRSPWRTSGPSRRAVVSEHDDDDSPSHRRRSTQLYVVPVASAMVAAACVVTSRPDVLELVETSAIRDAACSVVAIVGEFNVVVGRPTLPDVRRRHRLASYLDVARLGTWLSRGTARRFAGWCY